MLRHYELFLAVRYLKKKRLAFFSIAAVALSVAMLIVVSSVMGGFVKQFRDASHSFYGDIIVRADSLMGFPYYDELIVEARKLKGVKAATALIRVPGLLRIDQEGRFKLFVKGVQILGINPESYSQITNFKAGLWNQKNLDGPPSLDLPLAFANDPYYKGTCIVGTEVVYNRSSDGGYDRKEELYNSPVIISAMALRRTGMLDLEATVRYRLLLIDDFETTVALGEQEAVYIPFDLAQQMSRMGGYRDDASGRYAPPRASQIQIGTTDGADLEQIRKQLRGIWKKIVQDNSYMGAGLVFEIWDEQEGISRFIAQLERDRALMTVLFAIMGVVSIFLVFCIFFVIVTEKTPDIGIIKSVGASSTGVGRIFLGYAATVGLVGVFAGLAMAWPFVLHINAIHDWIAATFGKVYDSNVLLFPHIPNDVDWFATAIIMICALAGSLVGSLIPAIRAALMKPIKALRYE